MALTCTAEAVLAVRLTKSISQKLLTKMVDEEYAVAEQLLLMLQLFEKYKGTGWRR